MLAVVKRLRGEDGQALVELAFVLPLLLLFLFGIIDFGFALDTANNDTNVANIAVREAAVIGTATSATCVTGGTTQTKTTLASWAQCEVTGSGVGTPTVCVADVASTNTTNWSTYATGDPIKVEASTPFGWTSILTGQDSYIGKVASPTTTISSSATMRLESSVSSTSQTGTNPFLSPTCTS